MRGELGLVGAEITYGHAMTGGGVVNDGEDGPVWKRNGGGHVDWVGSNAMGGDVQEKEDDSGGVQRDDETAYRAISHLTGSLASIWDPPQSSSRGPPWGESFSALARVVPPWGPPIGPPLAMA